MTGADFGLKRSKDFKTVTSDEFPEIGVMKADAMPYKKLWKQWLNVAPQRARQHFEDLHAQWQEIKTSRPAEDSIIRGAFLKMGHLDVAALPAIIEKVEAGENAMIPVLSEITNGKLKETATREECLAWWTKNKDKWLAPFQQATR